MSHRFLVTAPADPVNNNLLNNNVSNNNASVTDILPTNVTLDIGSIVRGLRAVRDQWRRDHQRIREAGGREFPSREALRDIVERLSGALFPMRLGPEDLQQESEDFYVGHTLDITLRALREQILLELQYINRKDGQEQVHEFNVLLQKQANLL